MKDYTARQLFNMVFAFFHGAYPHQQLELIDDGYGACVYQKGECKFNTEGYNLLYNLYRLCNLLKDELI